VLGVDNHCIPVAIRGTMFYGKTSGEGAGNGRGNRNDRFEQMVKQQQLIEQKKQEIQARIDADRQKITLETLGKSSSSPSRDSGKQRDHIYLVFVFNCSSYSET